MALVHCFLLKSVAFIETGLLSTLDLYIYLYNILETKGVFM
jgi:hypothetical protein